jgi:hypothetical protein
MTPRLIRSVRGTLGRSRYSPHGERDVAVGHDRPAVLDDGDDAAVGVTKDHDGIQDGAVFGARPGVKGHDVGGA